MLISVLALLASAAAGAAGWWWTHRPEPVAHNQPEQKEPAKQAPPTTSQTPVSPGQEHLDNANEALENEEYDQAIRELDEAIKHFEDAESRSTIFRLRGAAFHGKAEFARAITEFDKAVELAPNESVLFFNRGGSKLADGKLEQALEDYSKAITIDPKFLDARHRRGELYTSLQKWEEAAADFNYCVGLNPNVEWAWNMLARVQLKRAWIQSTVVEKRNSLNYTDTNYKQFEETCVSMLRHFKDTADADTAGTVVWTCVLTDNRKIDKPRLLELAEVAGQSSESSDHIQAYAAANYRLGQFKEFQKTRAKDGEGVAARHGEAVAAYTTAIQKLTASLKDSKELEKVWRCLFLSMAYSRMAHLETANKADHTAKAREALKWADDARAAAKAAQPSEKDKEPAAKDGAALDWVTQLELDLLRQEAGHEIRNLPR